MSQSVENVHCLFITAIILCVLQYTTNTSQGYESKKVYVSQNRILQLRCKPNETLFIGNATWRVSLKCWNLSCGTRYNKTEEVHGVCSGRRNCTLTINEWNGFKNFCTLCDEHLVVIYRCTRAARHTTTAVANCDTTAYPGTNTTNSSVTISPGNTDNRTGSTHASSITTETNQTNLNAVSTAVSPGTDGLNNMSVVTITNTGTEKMKHGGQGKDNGNTINILVAVILTVFAVAVIICIALYCRWRRKMKFKEKTSDKVVYSKSIFDEEKVTRKLSEDYDNHQEDDIQMYAYADEPREGTKLDKTDHPEYPPKQSTNEYIYANNYNPSNWSKQEEDLVDGTEYSYAAFDGIPPSHVSAKGDVHSPVEYSLIYSDHQDNNQNEYSDATTDSKKQHDNECRGTLNNQQLEDSTDDLSQSDNRNANNTAPGTDKSTEDIPEYAKIDKKHKPANMKTPGPDISQTATTDGSADTGCPSKPGDQVVSESSGIVTVNDEIYDTCEDYKESTASNAATKNTAKDGSNRNIKKGDQWPVIESPGNVTIENDIYDTGEEATPPNYAMKNSTNSEFPKIGSSNENGDLWPTESSGNMTIENDIYETGDDFLEPPPSTSDVNNINTSPQLTQTPAKDILFIDNDIYTT